MGDMSKTNNATAGYIVISDINPALILCTDGEFHNRSQVGPGGWCAKVYKTEAGARKSHPGRVVRPLG
jgi:hypothetical protein